MSLFLWTFLFLLFALFHGNVAACAEVTTAPVASNRSGLPLAIADFDGDTRPDVAVVQVGRSNSSQTDYWIQLQLSSVGRQTILVVAPAGGLQIVARDVNGDDAPDLILTTTWLNEPVAVYLNSGHGSFSRVDPSNFPGAFAASTIRSNLGTRETTEIGGAPQRSRFGNRRETGRRLTLQQKGVVPSPGCVFVSARFSLSPLSRAPPSVISSTKSPFITQ